MGEAARNTTLWSDIVNDMRIGKNDKLREAKLKENSWMMNMNKINSKIHKRKIWK